MAPIIRLIVLTIAPSIYFVSTLCHLVLCSGVSGPPHLAHRRRSFFLFRILFLGALPHQARTPVPKAAMIYKLATSRPPQAVDTSDNSRRPDGDGGGAAGTSLAGVGAVSAIGNQPCEIPLQVRSPAAVLDPTISRRSRSSRTSRASSVRAARSPGFTRSLGNVSLPPGGVAARRTD